MNEPDEILDITAADEMFEELIERSSLGTAGAQRLRRRTARSQVDAVRRIVELRHQMIHNTGEESTRAAHALIQLLRELGYHGQAERVLAEAFPDGEADSVVGTAQGTGGGADRRPGQPAELVARSNEPRRGFWGMLSTEEREALRREASAAHFRQGQILLAQNEVSSHVVILMSGYTKVVASTDAGHQVVLAFRGPGDVVGEMVSLAGGRRSATIIAIDQVDALLIDAERFLDFLTESTNASDALTRVVVNRLIQADRDRLAAGSMTAGQRLAMLLLRLAEQHGVPSEGGGTEIVLALSQRDLAACVGASLRTVAREMEGWRQRGFISTGRRRIIVQRPVDLRRIAGLE